MTDTMPLHWSPRGFDLFLLAATWEVDRHARETQRLINQLPSRPTLHQRLDALEERMHALEQQR